MPAPLETLLETLAQSESARLFNVRAVAVQPDFQMTNQNAPAVAQICMRLDGIPLALELAAARVNGLSVQEIAARLDDRFRLLTGGSRTSLPRQRTLHATMDWSYRLLSDQERVLLQRVSVFTGGWTLGAAEFVCAGDGLAGDEILDLLLHLVEKSLVVANTQTTETRYHMLETIRQYAQEKLDETNQSATLRDQHLDFFCDLVAQLEPQIRTVEQLTALERLDAEYDNVCAALRWSLTSNVRQGLRMGWDLRMYWRKKSLIKDAEHHLLALLNAPGAQVPTIERAMALNATLMTFPSWLQSKTYSREALSIAHTIGNPLQIALAMSGLATPRTVATHTKDLPQDRMHLEGSLAILRTLKDPWHISYALSWLGVLAASGNDHDAAHVLLQEGLAYARETRDRWLMAAVLGSAGAAAILRNALGEARTFFQESLTIRRAIADQRGIAVTLNTLGECARLQGAYREAVSYYDEAQRCYQPVFGFPYSIALTNQAFAAIHLLDLPLAIVSAQHAIQTNLGWQKDELLFALTAMAAIAVKRFEFERAAQLMGYVYTQNKDLDAFIVPPDSVENEETMAAIHAALNQETFDRAWTRGCHLTEEQVTELALSDKSRSDM